ncbi:hypothetical protein ATN88_07200 [Enterovibrio coralii]|uniref:Leucine-rich repeat domain-containing protein n=1 Tax=Enterovibrio coralii TaxID=294935 RepID=A0A135IDK9_9GAMM|nr:hypothetical protein ATN88_07200 [Enterovibrio coralii]
MLLVVFTSGVSRAADIEHVLSAMEALNARTEKIIMDAEKNSEAYDAILSKMEEAQGQSNSALAAIRAGNFGKLKSLALANVALGNQYVKEYQRFLSEVGNDSSCYRPEVIDGFNDNIAKVKTFAQRLPQIQVVSSEQDANIALMDLFGNSAYVFVVPTMFAAQTLCIVGDAEPVFEQFNAMEGDIVAGFLAQAMTEGELGDEYDEMEDIEISSLPIDDIAFTDPLVEVCVKTYAASIEATRTDELFDLLCTPPKGSAVQLNDLSHFQGISDVTFIGVSIADLSPLNTLPYLNNVVIENSQVSSLGDLSALKGSLTLLNADVEDITPLITSGLETVYVDDAADCRALSPFLTAEDVVVVFTGGNEEVIVGEDNGSGLYVVTNCTKDSVK